MKKILVMLAALLSLTCVVAVVGCGGEDWPSGPLAQLIPKAEGAKVDNVYADSENYLSFSFEIDEDDYNNFVAGVKEAGFVNEAESTSYSYEAFDQNGNKYHSSYIGDSASVSIDPPETLSSISWPSSGLASKVPTPEFTKGKIVTDKSDSFSATIEMSKDDYAKYVEKLYESGYSSDYSKSEKSFYGTNSEAIKVTCNYKGNNRVSISIKPLVDDDTTAATTAAQTTAAETTTASSDKVSLREFADEYEEAIDAYIAFMKNYDPTDVSKLSDYQKVLKEYTDVVAKAAKVNTSDFSTSDVSYYTNVITRCSQKLKDAGLY